MREPLKVFITYSHNDRQENEELKTHLAVMERRGDITIWDDNQILPGDEWYKDISNNLAASDIVLYLVSSTSLASENCNKEFKEARSEKPIRVIPIILEHCDWENHELGELQGLPKEVKPINEWQPKSRGWQDAVDSIRKVVNAMRSEAETPYAPEYETHVAIEAGNYLIQTLGQTDWAIDFYSRAIEISPNNATAYNNRGVAYVVEDNQERAIADFTRAIELYPDFVEAHLRRSNIYFWRGDFDKAIKGYTKVIELEPDNVDASFRRGQAYSKKGCLAHAEQDLIRAIELGEGFAHDLLLEVRARLNQ